MFPYVRNCIISTCKRSLGTTVFNKRSYSAQSNYLCVPLSRRRVLKICGPDTIDYLQGMLTNDVQHLSNEELGFTSCLYSMLLTSNGRVLYDTLLYKVADGEYLLECDAAAQTQVQRHLEMFRLRKNVSIKPENKMNVWVVLTNEKQQCFTELMEQMKSKVISVVKDPRVSALGCRVIVEDDLNFKTFASELLLNVTENGFYDILRYKLGIGEGVMDHPPGKCLPLECNLDYLHGVSFQKGCYIGQELMARIHYTGVLRKRLMPITFPSQNVKDFPTDCVVINEKNMKVGKLRSCLGLYGLAALNVEESLKSEKLTLKGYDFQFTVQRPNWWPQDVDTKPQFI